MTNSQKNLEVTMNFEAFTKNYVRFKEEKGGFNRFYLSEKMLKALNIAQWNENDSLVLTLSVKKR